MMKKDKVFKNLAENWGIDYDYKEREEENETNR